MFGDEDLVAVFGREHVAGVEAHAQRGHMRTERHGRRRIFSTDALLAELRIGDGPAVAIGEAEVEARLGGVVEFVGREIIAQMIAAIVGEPQFVRLRMPVEADRIAHAPGVDFQLTPVRVHAHNRAKAFVILFTDITWRADRDIQLAIRPEADELPAVAPLPGEGIVNDGRFRHFA